MTPVAGNNDGDVNQTAVFIATSLDTRLVTTVSGSDTVSDFKKKITAEHLLCFPGIGNIIVHSLKVKRRGIFYNLSDSMRVKSAFRTTKGNWFVSADASCLEHKVGDELALPWVTHNNSIKTIPFENQIVSNVVDGDSCKDVSENPEENVLSDDKQLAISKGMDSKKRARDVNNESLLNEPLECGLHAKKIRKSRMVKSIVKPSEENIVLTNGDDKVKDEGICVNNENTFECKSKDKDLFGEKHCDLDRVAAVVHSSVVANVAMVAETNIQHGVCEREKENEPVQKTVMKNEIPSSLTRTSDCERDAVGLVIAGPHKAAEKEPEVKLPERRKRAKKSATKNKKETLVMHADDNLLAPVLDEKIVEKSEVLETALIDDIKKKDEMIVKMENTEENSKNKLKDRSRRRKKDVKEGPHDGLIKRQSTEVELESKKSQSVDHRHHLEDISKNMTVSEVSKVDNKVGEEEKNDKFSLTGPQDRLSKDQSTEVELESKKSQSVDPCHRLEDISKNVAVAEVSKVGEEEKSDKISLTGPQERSSMDLSTEVELESKKSQSVDHVDHHHHLEDASKNVIVFEVSKVNNEVDITNDDFVPGDQPNKTGSIDNQKDEKKPKKKRNEGLVKAKKNNKSSLMGPPDRLSKDRSTEVELEPKKSQSVDHVDHHHHHLEDASKSVIVSEVSKVNNEVDTTNDDFAPGDQPNKTGTVDNQKDAKKPKKKTNEGLVKAKKSNKLSLMGPPDRLSKLQSTEVDLESKKSQSVDRHHHLEEISKNLIVSEVSKFNSEVDITNDGSRGLNFVDDFAPGEKSKKSQSVDHHHHLEDTSKNVIVSEVSKVNITNDGSRELNFVDHFAPGDQPNKTASIDNQKDTKKPKKKAKEGSVKAKKNNKSSLMGPPDLLRKDQSTEVELESKKSQSVDHCHPNEAGSQEINFMDYFSPGHQQNKTDSIENRKDTKKPKKIISKSKNKKVDAESSSSSQSFRISFHNKKSNKQQSVVGPVKKVLPVANNLLKTPAKIFGDYDSDKSSADDNAIVNSDSSTRTPSRNPSSSSSSSSGDSATSLYLKRNRSYAMKRKEDGGKNSMMSQNKLKKNMSMSDLFRSSSRFKKAKLTASQVEDTESQPVDFVPDSQPLA